MDYKAKWYQLKKALEDVSEVTTPKNYDPATVRQILFFMQIMENPKDQ